MFPSKACCSTQYPGGMVASTSRGWRFVGLGVEMGGFRDQGVEMGRFRYYVSWEELDLDPTTPPGSCVLQRDTPPCSSSRS